MCSQPRSAAGMSTTLARAGRAVRCIALVAVLPGTVGIAEAAPPATLACTAASFLNWWAETPELIAHGEDEFGAPVFHLAPASGEWFLSNPGSAALTSDGGQFSILRSSEFVAQWDEWVGIEGDSMMRVSGDADRMRFVYLSRDQGAVFGACIEPDERFIFFSESPTP